MISPTPQWKKFVAPVAILVSGLLVLVFCKFYNETNLVTENVDFRLRAAAGTIELLVSDKLIDDAQQKIAMEIVLNNDLQKTASKIAEIHNVAYVYVMVKSGDSALFVICNYLLADIEGNRVISNLDYFNEAPPELISAFGSTDKEVFCYNENKWGTFRSVYLPRTTKSGTPYLLCADIYRNDVSDHQLRYLLQFAIASVFLFLISLPLIVYLRGKKPKK